MENAKIHLQNISKSYYSDALVTQALCKINLTFPENGFVIITGESGSGKSTLLNIIAGMDTFDDGEMFVDGEPTFQFDETDWDEYRKNKIGYIFQDYMLVGHYTALTNVMTSLLIMGYEQKQAEKTAKKYIKEVGLEGFESHKASKLSSGQKQRLSIARALAKNTGIIVADEPTGNLDSETGMQIVKLLKKLSKDHLVIMVTHNYEQAAEYADRKIRLHDGTIVSDFTVSSTDAEAPLPEAENQNKMETKKQTDSGLTKNNLNIDETKRQNRIKEFLKRSRTALYFAWNNCRTQLMRSCFFLILMTIAATASFLFIGELFMYQDDTLTKGYNTSIFCHKDPTRLVLKRADGKGFSQKDVETLYSVPYIKTVDSCDYANDINYYWREGKDYKYGYGNQQRNDKLPPMEKNREIKTVLFLRTQNFMMSTDCITKRSLAKGRLPENRNEIVLYSADESLLGSKQLFYFQAQNFWPLNQYYCRDMTVVGILKEETEQVYFSKELCQMLSIHMDYGEYRLIYNYDYYFGDYRTRDEYIPVIADDLTGNEARMSFYHYHHAISSPEIYPGPEGNVLLQFQAYDKEKNLVRERSRAALYVLPMVKYTHDSSIRILELSEKIFYTYYPKNRRSLQASVYLTSYAKIKPVVEQLERMGYLSQSTYQVSVSGYNTELVRDRLTIIGISVFGLVAILFAQMLILRSFMKIRLKDFVLLKFFGLKMQIIRKISYIEIGIHGIAAVLLTTLIMQILWNAKISFLNEMMWYYESGAYLAFIAYSLFASAMTAAFFNRLLKKQK